MTRRLIGTLVFLSATTLVWPQGNCSSLRYQDTIFHSVTIDTGIYFASAIPYGSTVAESLYLDFYQPTNDTLTKRPLIVYQFGGGFVIGWREEPDIPQFCTYFAQLGYAVATIDYRLGLDPLDSNSTVRAYYRAVQDERSAIRYLCQNAELYGIDTSNIILTGTSAGCFCSFVNGYTDDSDRPAATFGSPLEPTDLGCMDCSGNTDFNMHIPHVKAIVDMWGAILDTNYIALWKNVPTIIFQGTLDDIVPYTYGYPFDLPVFPPVYGAVPIHQRMDDVGILNRFHPLVGYGHEPELLAPWLNDTIYNYSRLFLYPLLKPNPPVISGDSVICAQHAAIYSVADTPGSSYCWQLNGNGTINANTNNAITVIWNDTGVVSVSVTELSMIDVQSDSSVFETRVLAEPQASFNYTLNQLQMALANTSAAANNYYWSFGNGDTSTMPDPVENYQATGTYTVMLLAGNGYCTDSFSNTITIDTCPIAHFTYTLNNLNGFFYGDSTNTISYNWYFGDGDSAIINSPSVFHAYSEDGNYEVILLVKNSVGCSASDTVQINIGNKTTGLTDLSEIMSLTCGPSGNCRFITSTAANYNFELFDVSGKKLLQNNFTGNSFFNIGNLAAGIYFLRLSDEENTLVRKWVKTF